MQHGRRRSCWSITAATCAGLSLPAFAAAAEDRSEPGEDPAPTLYLVAARQKPRIAESLRSAGVHVVDDILASPALLRVTVGDEKGFRDCGSRNNVKFALQIQGVTILELAEAGWTGSCEPNVFDALSARLARSLAKHPEGDSR